MNTATADGSRALYGISKDGLTIKQLGTAQQVERPGLRHDAATWCINILFVLFIGNIFGILAASNIGYVLAHVFALSAFILLRRDRPNWPRPIKLANYWTVIAGVLCAMFIVFTVVGVGWFQIAAGGYGKGAQVKIIGFGVLVDLAPALLLPPQDRAGQGAGALARGDSADARRSSARRDAGRARHGRLRKQRERAARAALSHATARPDAVAAATSCAKGSRKRRSTRHSSCSSHWTAST